MARQKNIPVIISIFGATGDLNQRKLIPALFDLYLKGFLPDRFKVVGVARRHLSLTEFQDFALEALRKRGGGHSPQIVAKFLQNLTYGSGLFEDRKTYRSLSEILSELENEFGQCSDKLFYLAVPPPLYEVIIRNLAASGLTKPCSDEEGWTRILIEKPFGRDIKTAQRLDILLGDLFREDQIFRIDHYLAKETVQNILAFRFGNPIFEPMWCRQYVERVELKLKETIGLENRGEFYDSIGALRDVGQNHMLQMLALVTMEQPQKLTSEAVRNERTRVLKLLTLADACSKSTQRAQYQGYHKETGASKNSQTETFFRLKLAIPNKRWQGVPFILESGKKLDENLAKITFYFKDNLPYLFPQHSKDIERNSICFNIQPNPGVEIRFLVKKPGPAMELEPRYLTFDYRKSFEQKQLEAYQKVLFDAIRGDAMLFPRTDGLLASWQIISKVLDCWSGNNVPLEIYGGGSAGPSSRF